MGIKEILAKLSPRTSQNSQDIVKNNKIPEDYELEQYQEMDRRNQVIKQAQDERKARSMLNPNAKDVFRNVVNESKYMNEQEKILYNGKSVKQEINDYKTNQGKKKFNSLEVYNRSELLPKNLNKLVAQEMIRNPRKNMTRTEYRKYIMKKVGNELKNIKRFVSSSPSKAEINANQRGIKFRSETVKRLGNLFVPAPRVYRQSVQTSEIPSITENSGFFQSNTFWSQPQETIPISLSQGEILNYNNGSIFFNSQKNRTNGLFFKF